ncbi:hypothetical protein [Citrobacter portucalensis]|uniref:hypothetical protein n=1 Tax=Citrobacter portucalensis TaxID=1639133 RepID=UPI003B439AD2
MFAGKKSAQIREILISESAWEDMTCLFAPSLAINMLEKAYDENNQALTKSFQLSLFTTQQKPCIPVNLPSPRTEVSRRMAALSRSSKTVKNTGVGNVKLTTSLMINPELNTEHNLKQNMQTFGETTAEVVDYMGSVWRSEIFVR